MCHLSPPEVESLYNNITWDEIEANYTTLSYDDFLQYHGSMCDRKYFEWMISWLVPVIFAVIVGVGIVGNVLVLAVVALRQQMRNTTNVLIVVSQ
jgi:hypothetical protein